MICNKPSSKKNNQVQPVSTLGDQNARKKIPAVFCLGCNLQPPAAQHIL